MRNDERRLVRPMMVLTVSACLVFIIFAAVQIIRLLNEPPKGDPHWLDTHVEASSVEQATQLFGSDLLLEKMILPGTESDKATYTLEFSKGGSAADRATWTMLTAYVRYINEDWVSLTIFFDTDHESINGDDETVGYNSVFEGDETETVTVNGTMAVTYSETSVNKYTYMARFERNNCIYFLTSSSMENADLGRSIIENLLNQQKQ